MPSVCISFDNCHRQRFLVKLLMPSKTWKEKSLWRRKQLPVVVWQWSLDVCQHISEQQRPTKTHKSTLKGRDTTWNTTLNCKRFLMNKIPTRQRGMWSNMNKQPWNACGWQIKHETSNTLRSDMRQICNCYCCSDQNCRKKGFASVWKKTHSVSNTQSKLVCQSFAILNPCHSWNWPKHLHKFAISARYNCVETQFADDVIF